MPENALLVNLAAMINQPLDWNLKSKILVIKTFPSRLVTALGLMLGSGVLLSGGSVLAANAYFAQPTSPGGPGGIFSINFGALLVGDTITFGDKRVTPQSFFTGIPQNLIRQQIPSGIC